MIIRSDTAKVKVFLGGADATVCVSFDPPCYSRNIIHGQAIYYT